MKRRMYFLFPDVKCSQNFVDELLLKRIEIRHIHVVAKDGNDIADLPEATIFQKNDIIHSLLLGVLLGGVVGIIAGVVGHEMFDVALSGVMFATTLAGAILGAWSASMIGMTTPNVQLRPFQKAINEGRVLVMVDAPKEQVEDIGEHVKRQHPEATNKGIEPTIPAFP